MDNEVVFAIILVALVLILARTLFSRRGKRRLISDHQTFREDAPGVEKPSEPDHDRAVQAPRDFDSRARG